ncbi:MAG: YgaP-like transmembrane domain [Planctomycetales bacterium]
MFPTTEGRVPEHTREEHNERIRREMLENVGLVAEGGPEAIDIRLRELDAEWDIERLLEANAASVVLAGVLLGATVSRKFFLLPGVVAGFLLQHALQGWCPPVPLFRRLGVRTAGEIARERYALKALRGDFQRVGGTPTGDGQAPQQALAAAGR